MRQRLFALRYGILRLEYFDSAYGCMMLHFALNVNGN